MQDQRGDAYCRKHVTDIDVVSHNHYGLDGPRASACPFESSDKFAELFVTSQAWAENIN